MANAHERAAILSIGDELMLGQTLDTNSQWLAACLRDLGIMSVEHVTVADDVDAHRDAIQRLAARVDVIISTGGLGPTADDLTRETMARVLGEPLVEDPLSLAQVEGWYVSRGREMPPINRVQALRPTSAVPLTNLFGTAPGLALVLPSGCDVFCLPGPPGEMKPMWQSGVMPRLRPPQGRTVRTRVLHCFGIGESDLATRLGELMDRSRVPLVGTTASGGVVSCRLRYEGPLGADQADAELAATAAQVRARAGAYIFGEGDTRLADAVIAAAKQRGETIGVVESCTGGLLGQLLTDVAGASSVFQGGLITYSNELKTLLAGVDPAILSPGGPGAVSSQTAAAMAHGGLDRLGCAHCLAITGIAGPDGGTPAKPVGTVWITLASRGGGPDVRQFRMTGPRHAVRDWAAKSAMAMLWQRLSGGSPTPLLRQV